MVDMSENIIICPIHQGPFNGKGGPEKNMLNIEWELHYLEISPLEGEEQEVTPHLTGTTPFLYVLFNDPTN